MLCLKQRQLNMSTVKTMNNDLLVKLSYERLTPTGEYEVSGFHEVDVAVASYFSRIFDNARVNNPNNERKVFNRFTERPPAERVVLGKFDSLVTFLQQLRKARPRIKSPDLSKSELPVINVSRGLDVVYSTNDFKNDTASVLELEKCVDTDGNTFAVLDRTHADLTYTISVMAFEKETLALVVNAISTYLRFAIKKTFIATTQVAMSTIPLQCSFTDSKELIWSDMSASISEDRLFAASVALTVSTDVVCAHAVTRATENYQVMSELGGAS